MQVIYVKMSLEVSIFLFSLNFLLSLLYSVNLDGPVRKLVEGGSKSGDFMDFLNNRRILFRQGSLQKKLEYLGSQETFQEYGPIIVTVRQMFYSVNV